MKAALPIRETDAWGSGVYGASRDGGRRTHKGVDFGCLPGTKIYPFCPGVVTKLGHPYDDDPETPFNELNYWYVQVTDVLGRDHRYFYVEPQVEKGETAGTDTVIGVVQDLGRIYKGITPHVHYEIKQNGERINPMEFI